MNSMNSKHSTDLNSNVFKILAKCLLHYTNKCGLLLMFNGAVEMLKYSFKYIF